MGSGKTLSMIRQAYYYWKQGYKIYANIHLKGIPYHTLKLKDILLMASKNIEHEKSCFLLDEAHIFIDARTSAMKRNRIISYWLLQTRKKSISLLYTTQYSHQIDKRLRSATSLMIECHSKIYNGEHMTLNKCYKFMSNGTIMVKNISFKSKDFYKYYDTREIVIPLGDD